ncbi:Glucosyl-3-phosphoglycerate/mannosyl-3-phosphoglycerate phosphatase [Pseudoruegeria aquimaris]|uniref:Glucosyl-3-phosphoglycerate/mannosyl-3-phosphoglycerate phosphatase n=1 Tax=Pseudoruegeria aquimaris TaxID=393663 RepID=A0A1Y5T0Z8_9RHOB|nr:HAD-IIB family hydrolase [Pseudoruegeria aquimaris]SLN49553.1 Glucosyl-3-phosphoglycerate/mannosyl-3-phosphoglycerate phosphatase [Pseudoruegeria aquimaris]
MPANPPFLVVTDLDGTLLDHESYDARPAEPALARLQAAGIPVVLASSKTAAEMAPLRAALGLARFPAIVENGAGLLPSGAGAAEGDADYRRLRAALDDLPPALRAPFRGFADMSVPEIAALTGLPEEDAALAARRQFSEPGAWGGDESLLAAFLEELSRRGVSAREGGRFLTLSFGASKADRLAEIAQAYPGAGIIALGDAPNDREMLEAADIAVVVANPHRPPLAPLAQEGTRPVIRTEAPGPQGWNAAIHQILETRGLSSTRSRSDG